MTTSAKLVPLSRSLDIPFSKLVLSQSNVRQINAGISLEDLREDIALRGLLQSLNVRPVRDTEGRETGSYEVPAGGRRFRALEQLVKAKRLPKTALIPCVIKADAVETSIEDDSLAENTHRVGLHPLDQYRAFLALRRQNMSEEDIAARYFVSVSVVKQRLRLAAVSPKLLDLYVAEELSLEQLMAFSVTGDHVRQEEVWEQIQAGLPHMRQGFYIRRYLTEEAVEATDRRARFVGLEAYEAAGGVVLRDLFSTEGGGWLQDAVLLDRLVGEKLRAIADALRGEGWKWIEVLPSLPFDHLNGLRALASLSGTLLLHKLVADTFQRRFGGSCLQVSVSYPQMQAFSCKGLDETLPAESMAHRRKLWADILPHDDQALWDWLEAETDEVRSELLAFCVSYGLNAIQERPNPYGAGPTQQTLDSRLTQAMRVARATDLDLVALGWRPTADTYLGRVSRARILEAVREGCGERPAQLMAHLKKGDMVVEAERMLADADWLPEVLRGPDPVPTSDAEQVDTLPSFLSDDPETAAAPVAAE